MRKVGYNQTNPKKSSVYDLITGKILEELPIIGTKYLTQLFNATLLLNYFPKKKLNSMVLVRERTIPTERPPLVGEVIANLCG
jgi:hypothetical protein